MTKDPPASWSSDEFEEDYREYCEFDTARLPAILAKDRPVVDSGNIEAVERLDELLKKYPGHPDLLYLRSGYRDNIREQMMDLREGIASAVGAGWPSHELRLGLAEHLIVQFFDYTGAKAQMDAAEPEVLDLGDEDARSWLETLRKELETIKDGYTCKCGFQLAALTRPECPNCGESWDYD